MEEALKLAKELQANCSITSKVLDHGGNGYALIVQKKAASESAPFAVFIESKKLVVEDREGHIIIAQTRG